MPSVLLIRRWGSHDVGATVTVDNVQARWLVDHAIGTTSGVQAPSQDALAPGTDGPDPVVSGDGTRRPTITVQKGERRDNNALPVEGSPVQYNVGVAPEPPDSGSGGDDTADGSEPSSKVSGSGRKRKPATDKPATDKA